MNNKALYKISYGLYVVTSKSGERINGQIANTVFQISNEPVTVAVSLNKTNLTNEFVKDSGLVGISVLSQETPLALIGKFGFKSGRDIDKFQGENYKFADLGVPYLVENVLSFMGGEIMQEVDTGTHNIFIIKITEAEVLKEGIPMTYAYYHQIKRGTVPKTAPASVPQKSKGGKKMDKYICTICDYVYEPELGDPENGVAPDTSFENLPEDWVCPVCGAGKEEFEVQS